MLERELRNTGEPFIPQAEVCGYHPDFYLPRCRTAVEVDGPWHWTDEVSRMDSMRDARLRKKGINVVRIPCEQIRENAKAAANYAVGQGRSYARSEYFLDSLHEENGTDAKP